MGTIVRGTKSATGTTAFGASTRAKASEVNTDFDTIYAEVNGNLDNDNIDASAAISASKLDLTTVSQNMSVTGNLTLIGNISQTGNIQASGSVTSASLQLTGAVVITDILDEDDLSSDSDVAVPTQQSVKAYADAIVADYGTVASRTSGTTYTAASSGILIAQAVNTSGSQQTLTFNLNGGSYLSTVFQNGESASLTMPVANGDTYSLSSGGSMNVLNYDFWPFG